MSEPLFTPPPGHEPEPRPASSRHGTCAVCGKGLSPLEKPANPKDTAVCDNCARGTVST